MPFSATAAGSVSPGTCSLTEDCQAGPNSAMPLPTTKHSTSSRLGASQPSQVSTVSVVAPVSAIASEIIATMRRSCMSAMAPAGIEISMIGSISAVCTSATLSADEVIWVIAQAAPTPWIRMPRLESRLASQMRRNTVWRSGAVIPSAERGGRFCASVISGSVGPARLIPAGASDACESCTLSRGLTGIWRRGRAARVSKTLGDQEMGFSRRTILRGAGALPLLASQFGTAAFAQTATAPAPSGANDIPPILFVHGNGDHAALWITTLWRMESNGVTRDRMFAINFTDPLARNDDAAAQADRSSSEDQRRELGEAIAALKKRTGAARVALVGNSRGGNSIRSYIKNGGSGDVSHAVLCGVPNHGVFAWDDNPGSEFNGRGPFLRGLNEGESEVTAGTAFLTLRSDGLDKYAQADGRFVGKPGVPTNVTTEGPALKGATNLVLGQVDHRETAYSPRAFREIFKFIAGREPQRMTIVPEAHVKLSGLVTGTPGGVQTNRPVAGAGVEVFRVAPDSGERIGAAIHSSQTGDDGRWGSVQVDPSWPLEIVLVSKDQPTTHFYRSPFPR